MKTSNQLLLALAALTVLALLSANKVLKTEYDKIDLRDPLFGYKPTAVKPFRVLRLRGLNSVLMQVQQGPDFEVRLPEGARESVHWQQNGDTLEVVYEREEKQYRPYFAGDAFRQPPVLYVMAPALRGVDAEGVTCRLKGWKVNELELRQSGEKGGLLLSGSLVDQLRATVEQSSILRIDRSNRIGNATLAARDSSELAVEGNGVRTVRIMADSTAQVQVPGGLLPKLSGQ